MNMIYTNLLYLLLISVPLIQISECFVLTENPSGPNYGLFKRQGETLQRKPTRKSQVILLRQWDLSASSTSLVGYRRMASNDSVNEEGLSVDDEKLLDKILQVAVDASKRAGEIILSNSDGADVVDRKSTSRDLLTLIDPQCEKAIHESVVSTFPHHTFLGEEQVPAGIDAAVTALDEYLQKASLSSGWLWIVDPIDGTTNFASGIPLNAPSIAVAYKGEVMVGVIYDPHRDEMFTAIKGRGAYMNGNRLSVGEQDTLGDAVIGMESPAGQDSLKVSLMGIVPLMPKVRTIRMLGSSAIMLPWVANGRLTGYWTPDECAWDISAGSLIVTEAGGKVTDFAGQEYTIKTRKLVASNGKVHDEFLSVLQDEANIS